MSLSQKKSIRKDKKPKCEMNEETRLCKKAEVKQLDNFLYTLNLKNV